MGLYAFSTGVAVARIPVAGGLYKSRRLPTLQEAGVKFDGSIKEMFGEGSYAEDTAGGSRKITGSVKMGRVNAGTLADIFFGVTPTTGTIIVVIDDGGTAGLAPDVSDEVDVGHTNITDMGVIDVTTGNPMDRVAATPVAGVSYTLVEATGIYTFAATQGNVRPSYRYADAVNGKTYEMGNPLLGTVADCELTLWKPRFTKNMGIILYHAIFSSLDLPAKREEYTEPTLNFSCALDPTSNSPGKVFTTESD